MSKSKSKAELLWFILIPVLSAGIWSYYYGINNQSIIEILKILIPIHLAVFIAGGLLVWGLFPRLSNSFRFGFWWGVYLVAPFYIWQIVFQYRDALDSLPKMQVIFYVASTIAMLLSAIAVGLITWAVYDIFVNFKKHRNPAWMIISRLLIFLLCFAVLMPLFGRNFAAQPELVKKRVRYRDVIERKSADKPPHNLIVIGIDGGNWPVMESLVEESKLPNIKTLMSEGRWGTLESEKPMISPMLWTTMFTGKTPEEHGISEWNVSFSKNRLVKAVWNILSEYGLRTTMINVPTTYPPEKINGKMISGFPYSNHTLNSLGWLCSSYPIKTNHTPRKHINLAMQDDGSYVGEIIVTDILMERYYADIGDRIFKSILLERILKNRIPDVYGSDITVAKIRYFENEGRIELYSPQTDMLIANLSTQNPNSDFLMVQVAPGVVVKSKITLLEMDQENISLYISPFFTFSDKTKYTYTYPHTLAKEITQKVGQYIVELAWLSATDLVLLPAVKNMILSAADTQAEAGNILFNEREWDLFIQVFTLTDRLQHPTFVFKYGEIPKSKFRGLKNADKTIQEGERAIEEAFVRCDNWIGDILDKADPDRDIILITSDHGFKLGEHAQSMMGIHALDGIYLLWGGPVKPVSQTDYSENRSETKSIIDVTKNILYLLDLPLAEDMGGKLWLDLLKPEYVKENLPRVIATYNVKEKEKSIVNTIDESTLEQLRGLGYLDEASNIEGD